VIQILFDNISNKFQGIFKNLRRKGKLTENDIKNAMKEVKIALLDADVNFKIVKQFINTVSEKALGNEVLQSLTPGQQIIKIVNEEMINILGNAPARLTFSNNLTTYMLVGLQGAGKTTVAGKLALMLKKQGKKVLLIACDTYRPAAITQLQVFGQKNSVDVFAMSENISPVDIAKAGISHALTNNYNIAIIDTAGRLNVDEVLMNELKEMKSSVRPQEILLVLDAMIGQEAVNIAQSFNEQLGIDGVIMTKLDSDTRGGAMLSVRAITQKPIKFIGVGEKPEDLEQFYPDRIASRILGMGDVLSIIEKAQASFDGDMQEVQKKILKNNFDLNDFYKQLQNIKKLGSVSDIMKMIPGFSGIKLNNLESEDKMYSKIEAIILSMTPRERTNPEIINGSRKRRIALGAGLPISQVNTLLKRFNDVKKTMKMFNSNKKSLFNLFN
jgi:signal recognition particle protein